MHVRTSKLLLTVLTTVLVTFLTGCAKEAPDAPPIKVEPENPQIVDCEKGSDNCREVTDCNNAKTGCLPRHISFSTNDCERNETPQSCENFRQRLEEVNLIADPYNFVSGPLTKEKFVVENLDYKLSEPWDLEFLPDDSMLVAERNGNIVHLSAGESKVLHTVDSLVAVESGLLGLAVDPQFSENGFIYIFYSYQLDESDPAFLTPDHEHKRRILNNLSRFTFSGGALEEEVVIMGAIPGSTSHTGGRLEFGPDGKLYAGLGDAFLDVESQDPDFLAGKIIRLNTDGSIPSDNPIKDSYVYSMGHRNPQGLAWHPDTGVLYQSEHGSNRFDEINRITPGGNYGWGSFQCDQKMRPAAKQGTLNFPLICFSAWTMAPSGMQFVSDRESPWYGSLFVAGLRGKHLHRYVFDQEAIVTDEVFYIRHPVKQEGKRKGAPQNARLRDVEYYKGSLYVIGDFNLLTKITPTL